MLVRALKMAPLLTKRLCRDFSDRAFQQFLERSRDGVGKRRAHSSNALSEHVHLLSQTHLFRLMRTSCEHFYRHTKNKSTEGWRYDSCFIGVVLDVSDRRFARGRIGKGRRPTP